MPDGAGLELHVDILGDEHDRRGVVLHQQETGGENPVIHPFAVRENPVEAVEQLRVFRAARRIVDHQAHGAAERRGHALGDLFRTGKHLGQPAMHPAGVRAALGLLGLELVQLRQHIHRDAQVVFLEALQRRRIMQQHVGVQHVVLDHLGRGREAEIRRFRGIRSRPPPLGHAFVR